MAKFAPKNDEGLAPYVITIWRFGRVSSRIVYAETVTAARQSFRLGTAEYVQSSRRATPDDITEFGS